MANNTGPRFACFHSSSLLPRLPVTYVDTNVLSDVSRRRTDLEDVRRNLCSFASKRIIAIGELVFAELSTIECGAGKHDFDTDRDFVNKQLQFRRLVKPPGELMRTEVEACLMGRAPDPFVDTHEPFIPCGPEAAQIWWEMRRAMEEDKERFLTWNRKAEGKVNDWEPDRVKRSRLLAADWDVDKHGIVARWIRGRMQHQRVLLGLPVDKRLWPRPDRLPTLWCYWAYLIARSKVRETSPNPLKLKDSDVADWGHYAAAAHCDEFVTSDGISRRSGDIKGFLQIAREAPSPKPEILSLDEWVRRMRDKP